MTANGTASSFTQGLRSSLASTMSVELALTVEVGVMSAGGLTRQEILVNAQQRYPHVEELDIRMALARLRRVAEDWRAV